MSVLGLESAAGAVQALVRWGYVNLEDQSGRFEENKNDDSIWEDYVAVNHYEWDYHRYMLGITSPKGFQKSRAAFVQLAAPTLLWIVDWSAARWNKQPTIPAPVLSDEDWVLLDEHYEPSMLVVGADGVTPFYRISGTYVYGQKNPDPDSFEQMNYTRTPWLQDKYDRSIPANEVEETIADVKE